MNNQIVNYVALKAFGFEGEMATKDTLLQLSDSEARPLLYRELIRVATDEDLADFEENTDLQAMLAAEAAAEAAAAEAAAAEAAAKAAAAKPAKTGKAK